MKIWQFYSEKSAKESTSQALAGQGRPRKGGEASQLALADKMRDGMETGLDTAVKKVDVTSRQ